MTTDRWTNRPRKIDAVRGVVTAALPLRHEGRTMNQIADALGVGIYYLRSVTKHKIIADACPDLLDEWVRTGSRANPAEKTRAEKTPAEIAGDDFAEMLVGGATISGVFELAKSRHPQTAMTATRAAMKSAYRAGGAYRDFVIKYLCDEVDEEVVFPHPKLNFSRVHVPKKKRKCEALRPDGTRCGNAGTEDDPLMIFKGATICRNCACADKNSWLQSYEKVAECARNNQYETDWG